MHPQQNKFYLFLKNMFLLIHASLQQAEQPTDEFHPAILPVLFQTILQIYQGHFEF